MNYNRENKYHSLSTKNIKANILDNDFKCHGISLGGLIWKHAVLTQDIPSLQMMLDCMLYYQYTVSKLISMKSLFFVFISPPLLLPLRERKCTNNIML